MKGNPIKRLFDIVAASLGLVVFFPVYFLLALLILLDDGGPVLFVQERLGRGMKPFPIYKFRTMRQGRVTRVGRWIRATGLDELLQFFNVLAGSMAMVGPRPMTRGDVARLGWHDPAMARWRCKPGMTGLAQLFAGKGRSVSRFLDDRYARSYSLFLDSRIVFLSFLVNCFGKGLVKRALSWWRTWQRNRRRRVGKDVARNNLLFYGTGVVGIYILKRFYSAAGADDLLWTLQPLAFLVELVTGIQFHYDPAAGFVSLANRVIIAPACAGVNFLIICFATLFFPFVSRIVDPMKKCVWLAVSVAAAYLVTLLANSVRIIVSIWLYGANIYGEWVTPDRVHRLAGTLLYVPVLVLVYLVAEKFVTAGRIPRLVPAGKAEGRTSRSFRLLLVPLAWYLTITVLIPLLNGAFRRQGDTYLEHSLFVLVATCLIVLLLLLPALVKKTVDLCRQTKEKRARQGMQQCLLKSQRERLHEATDYDR